MKFLRRHPYLITLALLLVVFPVPALAIGEDLAYGLVTSVFGMFVRLAAMLLNAGVNTFVIGFGDVYAKTGVGYAVDTTWIIIRDFVNMAFIFGFVYIGFKMILNSNDSNTRRWLVNLLLAALLVNFSLFITKVTIDFSNQLASQIVVGGLGGEYNTVNAKGLYEVDIGLSFMKRMGITSVWENRPAGDAVGFGYIFGMAILFMVTAFVFAAGGILLIIRFAVLNLFLVLSPLMFLSWILPPLKETMNRYWGMFLGRVFFAPIYLLFIYFSLQIISGLQIAIGNKEANLANPNWASTFQAVGESGISDVNSSTMGTLPFFVLICIFMIASLVIAQKMGADGGTKAVALGNQLRNKVQRGVTNTGKYAAAQTGGRAARWGAEKTGSAVNRGLRNLQQSDNKFIRGLARSNAVQGTVEGAADSLKKSKFGLSRTIEEDKKLRNQTDKRADNAMIVDAGLQAQKEKDLAAGGKVLVDRGNGKPEEVFVGDLTPAELAIHSDPKTAEAREKKIEEMQRTAADLAVKDFEAMTADQQVQISQFLTGSQTDNILKSDNVSDAQKKKISDKQKEVLEKSITENGELLTEKLGDLSIRQIETLGDEFVTRNAALFSDSQFSDIKKSKKFTEGQVGRYIGKRKTDLKALVDTDPDKVFKMSTNTVQTDGSKNKSRKAAEIAKLPGDVLTSPNAVGYLNVDVLKAIGSGDKEFERVSTAQREEMARMIKFENDRYLGGNPQFKKAADYLKSPKGQEVFFGN